MSKQKTEEQVKCEENLKAAAAALGSKGGKSKSEAKRLAAQKNGLKGGDNRKAKNANNDFA